MDCPACGGNERKPLDNNRYECVTPTSRAVSVTPPPTTGSAWGPVLIEDPIYAVCGVVYTDVDQVMEHRRSCLLLVL